MVIFLPFFILLLPLSSSQCDPGFTLSASSGDCQQCGDSCGTCLIEPVPTCDNCVTCPFPEDQLVAGYCHWHCNLTLSCNKDCIPPCGSCGQYEKAMCGSCLSGYLYATKCWSSCPAGSYKLAGAPACAACDTACKTCSGPGPGACTVCSSGYYRAVDGCYLPICGDGHITPGEECDFGGYITGSVCVNCKLTTPCNAPQLLAAEWIDEFTGVVAKYDQLIGSRTHGCDMFQEAMSFGRGAECDIAGSQVRIQLGTSPTLHLPLLLHILPDSLMGLTCPSLSSFLIPVQSPPLPPFSISIAGPTQVSSCDYETVFDIYPAGSGRLQSISRTEWRFYKESNGVFEAQTDLSAEAQQRQVSLSTVISTPLAAGDYRLTVHCEAESGDQAVAHWNFTAFDTGKVRVASFGFGNLTVGPETQLTFRAQVEVNATCLGVVGQADVAVSWSLSSESPRASQLRDYVVSNPYGNVLALPSYFLQPFETISLSATAWIPSLPEAAVSRSFSVTCERGPLIAVLSRYQAVIGTGEELVIDAGASYRVGENTDIQYLWHCEAINTNVTAGNSTQAELRVPAWRLTPGRYRCYVGIQDGFGTASADALVDVLSQPPVSSPSLQTSERSLSLVDSHSSVFWLWDSPHSAMTSASISPSTSASLTLTPSLSRISVHRGETRVDSLQLSVYTNDTQVAANIPIPVQPYGGSFNITPDQGFAYVTEYRLIASDWLGTGLKYQFSIADAEGGWTPLTDFLSRQDTLLRLPVGPLPGSLLRVSVTVCNLKEACGTQEAVIRSQSWSDAGHGTAIDILNESIRAIAKTDAESAVRTALLAAELLPRDPEVSDPSLCLCFNGGHCTAAHCVCPATWAGRYCQTLESDAKTFAVISDRLTTLLRSSLSRLPGTAVLFENSLRAVWALYERSEYTDPRFDAEIVSFLAAKGRFEVTNWLYTDITMKGTPITNASAELLIRILATSYDRLGEIYPTNATLYSKMRLDMLSSAVAAIATQRDVYRHTGQTVTCGSLGLPIQTQIATVWVAGLAAEGVTIYLEDVGQPGALGYVETLGADWRPGARLTPVIEILVVGQWTGTTEKWQWVDIIFKGDFRYDTGGKCGYWAGTDWETMACSTNWINNTVVSCNCTSGTAFTVLAAPAAATFLPVVNASFQSNRDVTQWVPIAVFGLLCVVSAFLMAWARGKDRNDEDGKAKETSGQANGSSAELVSGEVVVSDPRSPTCDPLSPTLTLSSAIQHCHYAASIIYRHDPSLSRPARVWLYLVRLTTISGLFLQTRDLPPWVDSAAARVAVTAVCVEAAAYTVVSLLMRLMKTYPEDNIEAVSVNPEVNVVQILKHSPQIKLFECRHDQPQSKPVTPFADEQMVPQLKQPKLQLSWTQRVRVLAGILLSVSLLSLTGLVHGRSTGDITGWSVAFPIVTLIDCGCVQTGIVAVQLTIVRRKGGCALLSRALREVVG